MPNTWLPSHHVDGRRSRLNPTATLPFGLMSEHATLVLTSNNVLLSDNLDPTPATIEVDLPTGKIAAIHAGRRERSHYSAVPDDLWIDAGDLYILPGLVE